MVSPPVTRHIGAPSHRASLPVLAVALLVLVACGPATGRTADRATSAATDGALQGQVLVSAAASLTDVFAAIERRFEQAHPDVDVVVNPAGSSSLREQVLAGAPVDVFAPADPTTMDAVVAAGLVAGQPAIFAHNRLQVAVPPGNPARISGLDDFDEDQLLLGLCAAPVPCGTLAREALDAAGVTPAIDTNEPDVRALLTKVAGGELDAGITYVTDVTAAGDDVIGVDIPDDVNVVARYPIAALADAPNARAAAVFTSFVLDDARSILAVHGFDLP